jgi:hypothetical protein
VPLFTSRRYQTTLRVSSAPTIEIRLAEAADASAIASLLAAAFAEYLPLYTPEGYAATAIRPEEIVSRIGEGPVWVSISGGRIVGTVSVVLKGESLYIRGMAVLPLAHWRVAAGSCREVRGLQRSSAFVSQHHTFSGSGNQAL